MLKIKDDVSLVKLKSFGFKNEEKYGFYKYNNSDGTIYYVFKNSRTISTTVDTVFPSHYMMHDKIFDLIQAGLVEKIDQKYGRS